jgi:imidazolonepropionase-like amidohydrolase
MRTAFGYKSLHLLDVAKKLVECGLEFADALAAMTHRPAKVLGLADGTGSIRVGGQADLTVLKWTPTSVSARQITL